MHSEWDLVNLDLPAHVFTDEHIAEKGQHYIVQFSSQSPTDSTYTDAIDVNVLQQQVDPALIYGKTDGKWGWTKTDHCQFIQPQGIVSPIRDATFDAKQCRADMSNSEMGGATLYGIGVVPAVNPDVVPSEIERSGEDVDPICLASCAVLPDETQTAGYCRLATADAKIATCASPAKIHHVQWANPEVSEIEYDSSTVAGAKVGDYIAFHWDDVVHDVWLVPPEAPDPCNLTDTEYEDQAKRLIPPSHHATIDQNTEDTVRADRNRYLIPEDAAGKALLFVCTINGHCDAGQQLTVGVGLTPATPDPKLAEGVCKEGYTLCQDQSKQSGTKQTVATNVNVPLSHPIGAETLRLTGKVTRASTPWDNWTHRKVPGKKCRSRAQNKRVSYSKPAVAGIDWGNRPVWDFPDHTLRDVLEACSSSHPEVCTGISWKGGGDVNHTEATGTKRTYAKALRTEGYLGGDPGWRDGGVHNGGWMQLDLGSDRLVSGMVTQARADNCCGPMGVTRFRIKYSSDGKAWTDGPGNLASATTEWLETEWAGSMQTKFKVFFQEMITARFIRVYISNYHRLPVMRAEVCPCAFPLHLFCADELHDIHVSSFHCEDSKPPWFYRHAFSHPTTRRCV
jgi:hypothetical protein